MRNSMPTRRSLLAGGVASLAARAAAPKIRIAFIGGSHSHALAKAKVVASDPNFEFAGIAEDDRLILRPFEAMGLAPLPLERVLNDRSIAAVAIESDVADHGRHGLIALEAGKHVHIEKPPSHNLDDVRRMVTIARSRRLVLQGGYMWRHNPGFAKAIEAARGGWLGDVYHVHGVMNTLLAPERRPDWGRFPGGQMFEQGGYMIEAMIRLLGRPVKVAPYLRRDGRFDDRFMDNTAAVLEFPRAIGVVRCTALQPNAGLHRSFEIQGTNGNAVLRPVEPPELHIDLAEPAGPYQRGRQRVDLPPYARYQGDFVELAALIRGERPPAVSLDEELLTHETLLRACGVIGG
jgi:predicted dehydrogenase